MSEASIAGHVAIVTGGARGIGRGIATRFVRDGAFVSIVDRDIAVATRTAEELTSGALNGGGADAIEADTTDRSAMEAVVGRVVLAAPSGAVTRVEQLRDLGECALIFDVFL